MYGYKNYRTWLGSRPLVVIKLSLVSSLIWILAVLTGHDLVFPDQVAQAARVDPPSLQSDVPSLITHLYEPHPNPFNPQTVIPFRTDVSRVVRVTIQDAYEQLVRVLEDRQFPVGLHEVVWNGRDDAGQTVPAGLYYATMKTGSVVERRKVLLVK